MSNVFPDIPLNTGDKVPAIGLGTWQSPPEQVELAVKTALENGYRHLDCAWAYDNEEAVGRGIKASGVPREEIFVTTKVWPTWFNRVPEALENSLKNLGLDYIDLYLMHWPIYANPNGNNPKFPLNADGNRDVFWDKDWTDTWSEMEKLPKSKVRNIGVSNVSIRSLEKLLAKPGVTVPAMNQVEAHPYLPQNDLIAYCKSKGIVVSAYSPLGSTNSQIRDNEAVVSIAKKYNVSPAQVLLSWNLKRGIVVLPKSVTPERIVENAKVVDLSEEDFQTVERNTGEKKRLCNPPWGVLLWDDQEKPVFVNEPKLCLPPDYKA
ncbi:GCY protein [Atractiella rhizophila]|nr:GCY protein [Atractiella rhizophila]